MATYDPRADAEEANIDYPDPDRECYRLCRRYMDQVAFRDRKEEELAAAVRRAQPELVREIRYLLGLLEVVTGAKQPTEW